MSTITTMMIITISIIRIVLRMKIIARLHLFMLPYKGPQVKKNIKSFKTALHKSLPNNIETKVVYTRTKLGSNCQIKDKTKFNHNHDLVHYVKCPEETL